MLSRARIITVCAFVVFFNRSGLVDAAAFSQGGAVNRKTVDDVCSTPECFHAASIFLSHMNTDVDPCDDFYEFACGKYVDSEVINDEDSWKTPLADGSTHAIWRALQMIQKIDVSKAPKPFADIKTSYENCIKNATNGKETAIREQWLALVDSMGGWPVVMQNKWNESLLNYTLVSNQLFVFHNEGDVRNFSNEISELSMRLPLISLGHIMKPSTNEVLQAYSSFMIDVAVYLGADRVQASTDFQEVLQFERELYEVAFPSKQHRGVFFPYITTTIGELDKKYPNMTFAVISGKENSTEVQTIMTAETLSGLRKLILSKPKKIVANWFIWRSIGSLVNKYHGYIEHRWSLAWAIIWGQMSREPKSFKCFSNLSEQSRFLLAVLYHAKYLNQSLIDDTFKIFAEMKQQYSELVQKAEWLGDITKNRALQKINKIKVIYDACREFLVDEKSTGSQNNVILSDDSSANKRVDVTKIMDIIGSNKTLSSAVKHHKNKCDNFFQTMAQYHGITNNITLGPTVWTDHYYDSHRPKSLNYGSFGFVIAHELSHSLDVGQRHYDENSRDTSWWDFASNASYLERARCFREQYGAYTVGESGTHLNGIATGPDDIADNVGMKVAYHAYDAWASKNEPEKLLPGLDYSPRELFWISTAVGFCAKYRQRVQENLIELDGHSLNRYRINGAMSNLPEFSRDFKCSPTARMNPVKKCTLW